MTNRAMTAAVCWVGAALLFTAPSADARWLDRVRGVAVGAKGIAIGSYTVHQASALQSLKQNAGELTDLFGDMLDAVKEGDAARVEDVWGDIKKVPGNIVKDAFPVLRIVDAAAALATEVNKRLEAAKRHIARFAGKAGGSDPRGALAVSEDERHFYASTTGILGDEPLPAVQYSKSERAVSERPQTEAWEDGSRNDDRPDSSSAADFLESHDRYESSLKALEKLRAASRGGTTERAELERGNYEEALKALDRRRSKLQPSAAGKSPRTMPGTEAAVPPQKDMAIAPVHPTDDSGKAEPTTRTPSDESNGPPDAALSRNTPTAGCVFGGWFKGRFQFHNKCNHEVTVFWCKRPVINPESAEGAEVYRGVKLCGSRRSSTNPYYTHYVPLGLGEKKSVVVPLIKGKQSTGVRWISCPGTYDETAEGFISERSRGRVRCKPWPFVVPESTHQPEESPVPQFKKQGAFLLTCDTLKRTGMSLCVEYKYEKASEHRAARNQCSSSGYEARLDASCPKGRGASVCLHTTDDSEALTYDYDPRRSKDEFAANCKRTRGRYLGSR